MNNSIIPYGRQFISEEDIQAVISNLKSDYLTQGPLIKEFEDKFAEYIGSKYAVAVSNGTAALHLAVMALNVSERSNVITTPITFVASANCVRFCGGNVWFADIDPHSYTLSLERVEELILSKPKGFFSGIIPVDFAGYAIDLEKFRSLADKYNLWIIEDACHAPGAYFIDSNQVKQRCGNGNFSDMSVFSFHPVKHIATGEGGMLTTNSWELYQKLLILRTHGIFKNEGAYKNSKEEAIGHQFDGSQEKWPGWYMEMQQLGYNYRITDFQAALGISQLARASENLERRKEIALKYKEAFDGKKWLKGQSGLVEGHAYHLYIVEIENRLGLYNYLKEHKIFAQVHYIPTHLMPYYKELGYKSGDFPTSEAYYGQCLSLPMYPTLTDAEQDRVINTIFQFYE